MADNDPASGARGLRVAIHGASHSGARREHNEDAYGFDPARGIAAVADGMGGFERGEVASGIAIKVLLDAMLAGRSLPDAFRAAHDEIRKLVRHESHEKVGTTAVVAAVAGTRAHLAWAGDSRAYLWRRGELRQLTQDHSLVAELVRLGVITEADARSHPHRNVVTRGLGLGKQDAAQAETLTVELEPGDRLLLCTDGLHGFLPESAIAEELARAAPADVPGHLVERTLGETGAGDNVTAVVLSFTT